MKILRMVLAAAFVVVSCQGFSEEAERSAALAVSQVRDVEYDVERLDDAITRYRKIAEEHGATPSGKAAAKRAEALASIQGEVAEAIASESDEAVATCERLLLVAPNYPPLMSRLAFLNYSATKLWARAVPKMGNLMTSERVMRIWHQQDSLFAQYPFRANPQDRGLGDLLCRQSVDVARMLEGERRYSEARDLVNRGLEYGKDQDVTARAKVYGAFYNYRCADNASAIEMAESAASNEHLSPKLRGRAHHVRGLAFFSIFEETGNLEDLDRSIDALNTAVDTDVSMSEARAMLRELRSARGKLADPAS